jgi:hypothetical protein
MTASGEIFLDINLPNAATWFYFSGLLAVALFVKFSRLLSIRNWDVLTMFLLMPGLLLLVEANDNRWGYVWLLTASGYFLLRCLIDLILIRRPSLSPNLNLAGLVWLACTLFVSLIAVAVRQPSPASAEQKPSTLDDVVKKPVEQFVKTQTDAGVDESDVSLSVERGLALTCHLAIAVGLFLIGRQHFEDLHAGMAAATFYLLLPYIYLLMPGNVPQLGRWDHAWPMAWMVWAVLAYRWPLLAGAFLGLATGSVFFPVLTLPVWISFYHGRGAGRFVLTYLVTAGCCIGVLGLVLWLNGELPGAIRASWVEANWQPWIEPHTKTLGVWQGVFWAYRMPVFLAYLAFVLATLFWPAPKNLAHVIALSAAVLIGIQFWYADRGGIYVLWYLPFLLLLVFRPNLTSCLPPLPPEDWLTRLGRSFRRLLARVARRPEPAAPVG